MLYLVDLSKELSITYRRINKKSGSYTSGTYKISQPNFFLKLNFTDKKLDLNETQGLVDIIKKHNLIVSHIIAQQQKHPPTSKYIGPQTNGYGVAINAKKFYPNLQVDTIWILSIGKNQIPQEYKTIFEQMIASPPKKNFLSTLLQKIGITFD